jgi:large subunit ribosomal protein L15
MPLQRRVPKFGFTNPNRVEYQTINLDRLQELVDQKMITDSIDFDILHHMDQVNKNLPLKVLGRGELKAKLKVSAHKFSASAKSAIEAAGGEAITI